MDIREVTPEEKQACIDKIKDHFGHMRNVLSTVEVDMESADLMTQSSSVWIGGQLCTWFSDFMRELHKIEISQNAIKELSEEIKECSNDRTIN